MAHPSQRTWLVAGAVCLSVALAIGLEVRQRLQESAWTRIAPDALQTARPRLFSAAVKDGRRVFERRCAGCHGQDLRGRRTAHTPDLTDSLWLYDSGAVSDIERTVLYGIRSGHPKAHNVTDMPSYWGVRTLSVRATDDAVEYIQALNGKPHDGTAAARGRDVFQSSGVCYDCHGVAAEGSADFGAPSLKAGVWLYGGDRATLRQSIAFGRHGECPAWIDVLKPAQIRAVAAYVYDRSHPRPTSP